MNAEHAKTDIKHYQRNYEKKKKRGKIESNFRHKVWQGRRQVILPNNYSMSSCKSLSMFESLKKEKNIYRFIFNHYYKI